LNCELIKGECLYEMSKLEPDSIDLILTDPPYGTVTNMGSSDKVQHGMSGKTEWDTCLDFTKMFSECDRILRPNGALVLFGQEPFTSNLIQNAALNLPFSYRMIWVKDHFANGLIAKKAPVNYYEDLLVFFKKYDTANTHPLRKYSKMIMDLKGKTLKDINRDLGHRRAEHFFYVESTQFGLCTEKTYSELTELYNLKELDNFLSYKEILEIDNRFTRTFNLEDGKKVKSNVLTYKKDYDGHHPTQKPVKLLEDIISTYSNVGDLVLDFTMGSGSTGVAAKNLGREFIGIEKDENYFNTAIRRIKDIK